tara:strand:+ start:499 stop:930 length:432 start_codon:yes stop_codon:yes gene_type:complete
MIYWFYGQPGAGKTTLADTLAEKLDGPDNKIIRIDGDIMRSIFQNKDYSDEGRRNNLRKVNDIARFLHHNGYTVIISVVAPFKKIRQELEDLNPKMIYVFTNEIRGREHFFAKDFEINNQDFIINTDNTTPQNCINEVLAFYR